MNTEPPFEEAPEGEGAGRVDSRLIVSLEGYEGPLDVLLDLARDQKVDLAQISILALAEQYLVFVAKARKLRLRAIAPGHGLVIDDPKGAIDEYISHRKDREKQVLAAVKKGGSVTIDDLVETIYGDTIPDVLKPVAARTTWAHLLKLRAEKRVTGKSFEGRWRAK